MQNRPRAVRKYSAPTLIEYGDMIKYTASGTAGNSENMNNMAGPTFDKP